jgi:hypothetical protein
MFRHDIPLKDKIKIVENLGSLEMINTKNIKIIDKKLLKLIINRVPNAIRSILKCNIYNDEYNSYIYELFINSESAKYGFEIYDEKKYMYILYKYQIHISEKLFLRFVELQKTFDEMAIRKIYKNIKKNTDLYINRKEAKLIGVSPRLKSVIYEVKKLKDIKFCFSK